MIGISTVDRVTRKRVMFAQHYGMGAENLKRLRSRPPIGVTCDECIYFLVNKCPHCVGTNRVPIPNAEVVKCRPR
jgi:hypothetical protein